MRICACCFNDEEIKQFITYSSKEVVSCDCCGQNSNVIDLYELFDFFTELLGLFAKEDNGFTLVDLIQKDWNIFSSTDCANTILSAIIENIADFPFSVQDKLSYLPEIQECFLVWKKLKVEVQEEKRYFSDLGTFNWETYVVSNDIIKKNTILYRSRITSEGRKKLKPKEMGCPPKEKATAGRANPLGIPYLYLCNDIETTYYEVRAVYLDKISVGKFIILRDLNIIDFNNEISLFYTYSDSESNSSLIDIVKRKFLFDEISADLSKPLRRFDTEIEYVPTQLICEYCKQNGADGIRFNSSLHKGGINIVLFNNADTKCMSVLSKEIKNVIIEGK
jgi:hypothetical protein